MYLAKVYVTPKPTVNDPQGLTVKGALHTLGYENVESVRIGKYIEIRIAESNRLQAEDQARKMCDKLLANPIMEDFRFELEEFKA